MVHKLLVEVWGRRFVRQSGGAERGVRGHLKTDILVHWGVWGIPKVEMGGRLVARRRQPFLHCAEARAGVEASHCTLAALAHLLQRNLHNSLTCQYNTPWTPVDCSGETQCDILEGVHLWNLELFSQTSLCRPHFLGFLGPPYLRLVASTIV